MKIKVKLPLFYLFILTGLQAQDTFVPDTIPLYHIIEVPFEGSGLMPADSPVRDVILKTKWVHENGVKVIELYGFWDGDGKGGVAGSIYKVRFCPVLEGNWTLKSVNSNDPMLKGQHQGMQVRCTGSEHPGFWEADPESAGGRWYRRSNGSHPYIVGNTMYSYVSEYCQDKPNGSNIEHDTRSCSNYYNKLRFAITGDIYPHPEDRPFLDETGQPTNDGNYSHRPNPAWFSGRVDLAVARAFGEDMIADLIINSVDSRQGRSVLRPTGNNGDPEPILRYMAARYGSYPNVWFCLSNEYNIRDPRFTEEEITGIGKQLRGMLAYPTPLSVHPNQQEWATGLNTDPSWNDHVIIQNKVKQLGLAADKIYLNYYRGKCIPVINDELAYQGKGDGWSEEDVLEAFLGAFLGGGYGSTGYKSGRKLGQYFAGNFNPDEHSVSDNLLWFRKQIENQLEFWHMEPSTIFYTQKDGITLDIFRNVQYTYRLISQQGKAYVLGASGPAEGITADLPAGEWEAVLYDLVAMSIRDLGSDLTGTFRFDFPDSRALFLVLKKTE